MSSPLQYPSSSTTGASLDRTNGKDDAAVGAERFDFTGDDLTVLRNALAVDLNCPPTWSDAEIRALAWTTLHAMRTLAHIATAQRQRGLTT